MSQGAGEDAEDLLEDEVIADNEGRDEDGLFSPKRMKHEPSPVWQCGGSKLDDSTSKCDMCGKNFKSGNNTSNLINHILLKHQHTENAKRLKELREIKKKDLEKKKEIAAKKKARGPKQSSIVSFTKKAQIDPMKKKKIDEAIATQVIIESEPLSLVEKPTFRAMIAACDKDYICPSRYTLKRKIEKLAEKTKEDLKKEIAKDLDEVPDKTIHLTSDHGTSHDRFRSHRNVLTASRCTKSYQIKTDTVALMLCDGSQRGEVIRKDVKRELDSIGLTPEWNVNWTTDGEAKQINARAPGKHRAVGLETNNTASCVDHGLHLGAEEALDKRVETVDIKMSTDRAHKMVEKMKESSLMKEAFMKTMKDAGEEPLAIIQGTPHRY
jgi:hypothetical protein